MEQRSEEERRTLDELERVRRICVALRAEIEATIDAAERRQTTAVQTLRQISEGIEAGHGILDRGPPSADFVTMTDATVYASVASDLGRFPPRLIREIVSFYAYARDVARI